MMKTIFAVALLTVCVSGAYAQDETPKKPIVQLVEDLEAGATRANLSDSQKSQLESDKAILGAAREAREQGQSVDRQKVGGALRDISQIVHSGAFSPEDQKKIDADAEALRAARGR
jgi:hypothetical protein